MRKKEKDPEVHQNSNDDTIGAIRKISKIQIQQHREMSLTANGVSCSKMVGPICFWAACVAHSGYRWSSSLMSANLHQVYYMFESKVVYAFKCVLKIYSTYKNIK
jgi:hypothetical protein